MADPQSKVVEVPDLGVVEFPHWLPDEHVSAVIRNIRAKKKAAPLQTESSEHERQLKPAQPLSTVVDPLVSGFEYATKPLADVPITPYDSKHPVASTWQGINNAAQNIEQMPYNFGASVVRGTAGLATFPFHALKAAYQVMSGTDLPEGMDTLQDLTVNLPYNLYKQYEDDYQKLGPMAAISSLAGTLYSLHLAGKLGAKVQQKGLEKASEYAPRVVTNPEAHTEIDPITGKKKVVDLKQVAVGGKGYGVGIQKGGNGNNWGVVGRVGPVRVGAEFPSEGTVNVSDQVPPRLPYPSPIGPGIVPAANSKPVGKPLGVSDIQGLVEQAKGLKPKPLSLPEIPAAAPSLSSQGVAATMAAMQKQNPNSTRTPEQQKADAERDIAAQKEQMRLLQEHAKTLEKPAETQAPVIDGVDFRPIVQDIRSHIPNATGIEVGGSFARGDMKPKSDIDIIVQLPPGTDQFTASSALDPLFKKYRDGINGRTVDFIAHVQGSQSFVGQHTQRIEQGLQTPKKTLWGQPYDDTEESAAYLKRVRDAEKSLEKPAKEEQPTKYKYGNTQAPIAQDSEAAKALTAAKQAIDPADLAGNGLENDPHITIRYGIDGEDTEGIKKYLESQPPFEATLGKTESFKPSEHSEGAAPIIAPVNAPDLHRMEQELDQHGNFIDRSFPDYRPHATIAYVRPEAAQKYVGNTATEGKKFTVNSVDITKKDGTTETVQLKGTPKAQGTGIEMARTAEGKVKLGADAAALGKSLGSSLYQGNASQVITKELLQNAMDAVREVSGDKNVTVELFSGTYPPKPRGEVVQATPGNEKSGYFLKNPDGSYFIDPNSPPDKPWPKQWMYHWDAEQKKRELFPEVDEGDRVIKITDSGKGMTKEELETVFTDLGASGKRDLEDASGGFGLAKAAPMMMSQRLDVSTVTNENGKLMRHSFSATPADLLGEGVDIKSEELAPGSAQTGTTITSILPQKTELYGAQSFINQAKLSLRPPGQLRAFHNGKDILGEGAKPIQSNPIATVEVPGAILDLYTSN